jgi:bacterioferritin-associated ferredoxin
MRVERIVASALRVPLANANNSHYSRDIMIVCICHRVSDRDIARAAQEGCSSFEELQDDLCVARACGACHDCARDTFHAHAGGAAPSAFAAAHIPLFPQRDAAGI